jgi:hypothetical protein
MEAFLTSAASDASFSARTDGSAAPYDEFLHGLRVRKCNESELHFSVDRWLELSGPLQYLKSFTERLISCKDGSHHRHWYAIPVSLIIEADDLRAHADES